MVKKIVTNLSKTSNAELLAVTDAILLGMTGNPNFPDAGPLVAEVITLRTKYENDLAAAANRDMALVLEKNLTRNSLLDQLSRLGLYLLSQARGDASKLMSTGFPLEKPREPGALTTPQAPEIRNGILNGELICTVKPVKHASMYSFEITSTEPGPDATWVSTRSSKSKHQFSQLQPGQRYYFRVVAMKGNQTASSPVVSRFAQ